MSPTDVSTSTPTPEAAPVPLPDDFAAYQTARRAQMRGEEQPAKEPVKEPAKETPTPEKPASPEAPAEPAKPAEEKPPAKTAAESGTGEEEEQETGEEPHGDKPTKPQPGKHEKDQVQKRFDKLTREKYELKGRIAALEEQLAAHRPAETPAEKPAEKPVGQSPGKTEAALAEPAQAKPKLKDFLTADKEYEVAVEEWTEALTDWKLAESEKRRVEQERQTQAEKATQERRSTWATKEAAVVEIHPDYQEVKESTEVVCTKDELGLFDAMLQECDRGPEVLYHLAQHQDELNQIVHLAPIPMARELGKIEAQLGNPSKLPKTPASENKSQTPAAPPPKVTSAPKPIVPVGGSSAAATPSVLDDALAADFTAWKKVRRAQERDR